MQLPSRNALKQLSRRVRRTAGNVIPEPLNLRELVLPEALTKLDDGTEFLQYDSEGEEGPRIIIFASSKNLDLLSRCKKLMSDGTFSTAPRHFCQLYTIHCEIMETTTDEKPAVFPLVFALLENKTQETYTRLLTTLNRIKPLSPDLWITDFEKAAINSIELIFPGTTRGCFFHLQQSLYRKVVEKGCKTNYEAKDGFFALFIKHISALAFLPVGEVAEAADLLLRQNDCPTEAIPIIRYFIQTYIGSNGVDAQPPLFPISFWNVYERTLSNCFRTNNYVEGWHRRFKAVMQCVQMYC